MKTRLAIIGFGEAGYTFAHAAQWRGGARAFDINPLRAREMDECRISRAASAADALAEATLVLSLVSADRSFEAAQSYAPFLASRTLWCDMNSVAPDTKRQCARVIEAAGGCYVDVAIMAPVNPAALAVPLLVSGPQEGVRT